MQDDAPPHYALAVRDWLTNMLPDHVIGRRGDIEWPVRFPDLTSCNFFMRGLC